jgi:hypothetical protein
MPAERSYMRMMMTVTIAAEAGNRGLKDGSLPRTIEAFMQQFKPEAAYFTIAGGDRTAIFVLSMTDANQLPTLAEPFFEALGAHIELTPAMNADDLKAGLQKMPHK